MLTLCVRHLMHKAQHLYCRLSTTFLDILTRRFVSSPPDTRTEQGKGANLGHVRHPWEGWALDILDQRAWLPGEI